MKVRIGVGLGVDPGDDSAGLAGLVDDLDELGFDSIWLPEVLTAPTLDPLVALAFAAAHNPQLKLGTTMLLPGRNLVRLAKAAGHPRRAVGRSAPRHLRAGSSPPAPKSERPGCRRPTKGP